ncbi:N-acetylmuramoyl-L-alanine amidase [Saccharothrix sp. HUAS TT1]|uniref:peptidoglycan recognition protein family protein n=1 Tax=unclassified Saccharothrix TaxID=2593673 RepID=UPI00345B56BC
MALCPFAVHRLIPESYQQNRITPRLVILHTAVSGAESLEGYWNSPGIVLESHFYVSQHGVIYQYVDTNVRADANVNANDFAVSIETWDGGNPNVPWTDAQVNALVRLVAWICDAHGIPKRLANGAYGNGIGWHNLYAYEWAGGPRACPGPLRIPQARDVIIPRVAGGQVPAPGPSPSPATEFPLPSGHYFGDISGPDESHGGYTPGERVWVRQVQQALQRAGKAPSHSGWADGVWEQPTTDAMRSWQASAGRPQTGRAYKDDWDRLVLGRGSSPAPGPAPSPSAPAWPLPRNEYFGLITGPAQSHGGYYPHERPHIVRIQQALQRKGFAPAYAGWADGIYEQPTANAVAAWQRAHMPGTTRYGEVWWDDWAKLLA